MIWILKVLRIKIPIIGRDVLITKNSHMHNVLPQ